MDRLFRRLCKIHERPALYFSGNISLSSLCAFIDGYLMSSRTVNQHGNIETSFAEFQKFVEKKYNTGPAASWDVLITLYSMSDRSAFEKFFSLMSEFLGCKCYKDYIEDEFVSG